MLYQQFLEWYFEHREFHQLKPNSQRNYRYLLRCSLEVIPPRKRLDRITAEDADLIFARLATVFSEHNAVSTCRVLTHLFFMAQRYGYSQRNPFHKMKLPALKVRDLIWEEEQVYTFVQTAGDMGYGSLGLLAELCWVLGQRPGDMRQLKHTDIHGHNIQFTQEKTHKHMSLYLLPSLRDRIAHCHVKGSDYLVIREDLLRPYNSRDYNILAFDVKRRARIPVELQFRDLRRTALTAFAEHEDDSTLKRISGHKSDSSLGVYRLNRAEQTSGAMQRRFQKT